MVTNILWFNWFTPKEDIWRISFISSLLFFTFFFFNLPHTFVFSQILILLSNKLLNDLSSWIFFISFHNFSFIIACFYFLFFPFLNFGMILLFFLWRWVYFSIFFRASFSYFVLNWWCTIFTQWFLFVFDLFLFWWN